MLFVALSFVLLHHVTTESSDYDHLTMEDLISYSFQVAKGMEFLSSRKVKLRLFIHLCLDMSCRHHNLNVAAPVFLSSAVHPQRSSSQKHPAVREQCGEDLRLWSCQRCLQGSRLRPQGRCESIEHTHYRFL